MNANACTNFYFLSVFLSFYYFSLSLRIIFIFDIKLIFFCVAMCFGFLLSNFFFFCTRYKYFFLLRKLLV